MEHRHAVRTYEKALDGELAVDCRNDDVVVLRRQRSVHQQDVAVEYAASCHRIACNCDGERCIRVGYEILIQREIPIEIILRHRGKTRMHSLQCMRNGAWGG